MKRIMIAALLCASSAVPVMAQAQDGDVLVMRRAIAQPTGQVTIPPSPDFVRVPLKVKDSGQTTYALNGTLKLEVEEVGCRITDGSIIVDQDTCAIGQGPQIGDIINFTAKMDPDLKAYYVPREQYEEILPAFSPQGIDALCSGSAVISGTEFSGSCDPAAVVNTYAKYIVAMEDPTNRSKPQNVSSSDVLNFVVTSVGCYSTQTGSVVSSSSCENITKSPSDIYSMPATFIPQLREVYIDNSDIDAMQPAPGAILNRHLSTFCTGSTPKMRVDDNDWKVLCGEPDEPGNYTRVTRIFQDPAQYGVNREPNRSETESLRVVVSATRCLDSQGNDVTGKCDYITQGPNIFDMVTVPATYVPELRELYVDRSDLESAAGSSLINMSNRTISDACAGRNVTISVVHEGVQSNWDFRCGTPDDPGNYSRAVSKFNDPMRYGINREPNDPSSGGLNLVVQTTRCNDASGNSVNYKCDYITAGPSLYDIATVPATYVRELREIYVKKTDVEAAAGSINPIMDNRYLNDTCGGQYFSVTVNDNGSIAPWAFHCGEPDDPANYTRGVNRFYDPSTYGSDRTPNQASSNELKLVVQSISCTNASGSSVNGKCDWLSEGPKFQDILTVPATYVAALREVYVDRAALQEIARNQRPIIGNNYIDDACAGKKFTVNVVSEGVQSGWDFRCGTPDDPNKYETRPVVLLDPRDYGTDRNINMDPEATQVGLRVRSIGCYDKTNDSTVDAAKCSYLPDVVRIGDVVWLPAVFDSAGKTVTFDIEDMRALNAQANYEYQSNSYLCTRNLTINVNNVDYKLLCAS